MVLLPIYYYYLRPYTTRHYTESTIKEFRVMIVAMVDHCLQMAQQNGQHAFSCKNNLTRMKSQVISFQKTVDVSSVGLSTFANLLLLSYLQVYCRPDGNTSYIYIYTTATTVII